MKVSQSCNDLLQLVLSFQTAQLNVPTHSQAVHRVHSSQSYHWKKRSCGLSHKYFLNTALHNSVMLRACLWGASISSPVEDQPWSRRAPHGTGECSLWSFRGRTSECGCRRERTSLSLAWPKSCTANTERNEWGWFYNQHCHHSYFTIPSGTCL